MLPESAGPVLAEYVRGGGALVSEARLAWNNERGYASDRIPGLGLWEVVGSRERAVETAPAGRTRIRWTSTELPGVGPRDAIPGRWYKEVLEPATPGARVVAEFEDGSPAAVLSAYGKGRTLMLGSYVSAAYQSTPTADAERFFAALLEWAGVAPRVQVEGAFLEARLLESGNDLLLFVLNHGRQPVRSAVVVRRVPGASAATDLVTGRSVPLVPAAGAVKAVVDLPPSGVQVLRISFS